MSRSEYAVSFPLGKFKFKCNSCGGCCRKTDAVQLTRSDYHKIKGLRGDIKNLFVNSPRDNFFPYEAFPFLIKESKNCIFFTQERKCSIWDKKPLRCNLYPLILGINLKKKILLNLERCPAILANDGTILDENFLDRILRVIKENLDLEKYFSWWEMMVGDKVSLFLNRKRVLHKILEVLSSEEINDLEPYSGFSERLSSLLCSSFTNHFEEMTHNIRGELGDNSTIENVLFHETIDFIKANKEFLHAMTNVRRAGSKIMVKDPFDLYENKILFKADIADIKRVDLSEEALSEVYSYLTEIIERDGYIGAIATDVEIDFYLRLLTRTVSDLETYARAYALYDDRDVALQRDVLKSSVVVDPNLVGYAREVA
jgi:Fe-S-cluster containining protein